MTKIKIANSLIFRKIESDSDIEILQTLINKIFEKTFFTRYGLFFKQDEITDKQYLVFDEKEIIGIFVFSTELSHKRATIDLIGVLPSSQNKKYGSKILDYGLKLIKQYNPSITEVLTEVIADDIQLSNFYIINGFIIDRIEFYGYNKQGKNILTGKPMDLNNILMNNDISHLMVWNFLKIRV
ncbi:MAG: hypothetical protein HeimC3_28940 [Candidatus Heimdallarchaeota archaeon LC_3]|nr:MAG: hypothetical protein HeimC3_28940 [Candidatus Heimdallarchaeota archaeon LC_3]